MHCLNVCCCFVCAGSLVLSFILCISKIVCEKQTKIIRKKKINGMILFLRFIFAFVIIVVKYIVGCCHLLLWEIHLQSGVVFAYASRISQYDTWLAIFKFKWHFILRQRWMRAHWMTTDVPMESNRTRNSIAKTRIQLLSIARYDTSQTLNDTHPHQYDNISFCHFTVKYNSKTICWSIRFTVRAENTFCTTYIAARNWHI